MTLAHGGGGKLMHQLSRRCSLPAFSNPPAGGRHDGAVFELGGRAGLHHRFLRGAAAVFSRRRHWLAGHPRHGNDLAMCGARPLYLSCGFIIEEGLPHGRRWPRGRRSMRAPRPTPGVQHRHRRHQGGGQGQGRRALHQHRGHRRASNTPGHRARAACGPATRCWSAAIGPPRHGHHRGARGPRVRDARSKATPRRFGRAVQALLEPGVGVPLPARPDARRTGQRA